MRPRKHRLSLSPVLPEAQCAPRYLHAPRSVPKSPTGKMQYVQHGTLHGSIYVLASVLHPVPVARFRISAGTSSRRAPRLDPFIVTVFTDMASVMMLWRMIRCGGMVCGDGGWAGMSAGGFLPDVAINREYAVEQLARLRAGRPQPDFWMERDDQEPAPTAYVAEMGPHAQHLLGIGRK